MSRVSSYARRASSFSSPPLYPKRAARSSAVVDRRRGWVISRGMRRAVQAQLDWRETERREGRRSMDGRRRRGALWRRAAVIPAPLMQIFRLGTHNRKCNLNAIFSIFRVNSPETRPKTSQTTSTERRCLVVTRDRTVDRVNASRSRYVTVHRPAFERASPSNPPGNFHIDCRFGRESTPRSLG